MVVVVRRSRYVEAKNFKGAGYMPRPKMLPEEKLSETVLTKLTKEDRLELERMANQDGISKSAVLRRLLRKEILEQERNAKCITLQ